MQSTAYRLGPTKRGGLSRAMGAAALVAIILTFAAAYVASGPPSKTVTSTTEVSTATSLSTPSASGPLVSYAADAYTAEVTALLNNFSRATGVQVAPPKSGGSFADANQIAAGAPDDVFVSVALGATSSQYLKNLTSNWAVGFASDQMVLAYANGTGNSATTGVIDLADAAAKSNATSDWNAFYAALTGGGVKVGISNPVSDPAGLRGWLVLQAAGYLYAGGNQQAYADPLVSDDANVTGMSASDLVSPLEEGQIQFLFIYKSAAVSDGLPFISLEGHVNFGSPGLGSFYSKFSYTDSAGTTAGTAIILCVTVPASSVDTAEALQFTQYVIQNAGTLSSYGLAPFKVATLYHNTSPPAPIQALETQGLVTDAGALP